MCIRDSLYALPGNGFKYLGQEYEAAQRAGVEVEQLERVPGLSFDTGPCLRYRNQAQFHPLKYLSGLTQSLVHLGGKIHGQTRALELSGDAGTQVVKTNQGKIKAKSVVVATNTPFNDQVVMHTKQAGYRTYVVGLRVPKGTVPRLLLWDTGDPYYYIRLASLDGDPQHEILILSLIHIFIWTQGIRDEFAISPKGSSLNISAASSSTTQVDRRQAGFVGAHRATPEAELKR